MKGIPYNERGIALFIVLWVMALLAVIAGEFCYAVRTEANITRNFKEETQTYYLAVSGLSWAVENLVVRELTPGRAVAAADGEEPQEDVPLRINAALPPVDYGDGQFTVFVENESGKINLNKAGYPLLKMMLSRFEMSDAERNVIIDSIMDWRDKDKLHRPNGAEDEYYLALPSPYRCKNGDFTSTGELLLVRGITPEIFYGGLEDMVSVYQDKEEAERDIQRPVWERRRAEQAVRRKPAFDFNKININSAPPQVLAAFPRMTENAVQEIMKYREQKDIRSVSDLRAVAGDDIYAAVWPYVTFNLSPYYTLKSVGTVADSRTRRGVQAVVKIDRRLPKGYEIVQWIDALEERS